MRQSSVACGDSSFAKGAFFVYCFPKAPFGKGVAAPKVLTGDCRKPAGIRTILSRLRRQLLSERSHFCYRFPKAPFRKGVAAPKVLTGDCRISAGIRTILSRLRRQLLSERSLFLLPLPESPLWKGGGAERRQWRMQRGGSPMSKGAQGSRACGNAARPLRIVGNPRAPGGGLP